MSIAISIQNVSKSYRLGAIGTTTLREDLSRWWARVRGMPDPFLTIGQVDHGNRYGEYILALKNVSLDISKGEVLGLIGRNGAGKSSLLKIMSRVTAPTAGIIHVRGRIASLLEVGTGFHPDLTGRENVFLNGAILGMNQTEIQRKLDAIIDFSEVERYIDTPVKRYSSGMYVRLAFSVAAHLEPDILLIDEVLAVGDLAFQQKCLNHLRNLTQNGMTIILVSHNMAAIQSACQRAVLLQSGEITADGDPTSVIEDYRIQTQYTALPAQNPSNSTSAAKRPDVEVKAFELLSEDGQKVDFVRFGQALRIRIELFAHRRIEHPMIGIGIKRGDGVIVCNFNNWYDNYLIDYIEGSCTLEGWLPPMRLVPDFYQVNVLVWPWGGGHLSGNMTRARPYVNTNFGDFRVEGPALNAYDGVFQQPAKMWRFHRGDFSQDFAATTPESIEQAFTHLPGELD